MAALGAGAGAAAPLLADAYLMLRGRRQRAA